MKPQCEQAAWWGMLRAEAVQADYEALLRLDDDVSTRQPVSEAQIAALPTHVHRVQVHRPQCSPCCVGASAMMHPGCFGVCVCL